MEYKYVCDTCKLLTNYKNVYDKHITSKKHIDRLHADTSIKYSHICDKCNKTYTTYSGLWKHQKKCTTEKSSIDQSIGSVHQSVEQSIESVEQSIGSVEQSIGSVEQSIESETDIHTKIKMNIIKILLDHVNRSELNKIIDEIYTNK